MARRWFQPSLAASRCFFDRPSRTTLTLESGGISGLRRQTYGSDAANLRVKSHLECRS
jgi:hypothetical protein